jgi:hypothetical protein
LLRLFTKYVYGRQDAPEGVDREAVERERATPVEERLKKAWKVQGVVKPPRPFTREKVIEPR